jgi:hypothetical protein
MNTNLTQRIIVTVAILAVAFSTMAFTPAPSVQAASGGVGGELTIVDAFGTGTAGFAGNALVKVTGNGILWVKDLAGDAKINTFGYGRVTKFPDGWTKYEGFNGAAKVQGSNIEVKIVGANVALHAEGTGKFYLRGKGIYRIGGASGAWTNTLKTYEVK